LCVYNNCLPQGAPTSPALSNIYLYSFDEVIANYCFENKIRFTRYADDLAFSADKIDIDSLFRIVKDQLQKLDLRLNESKNRIYKQNDRQVICGIVVNQKMQVSKKIRNDIRKDIYYIKKYGLADHLKYINCTKANYLNHLLGKVNYILSINPKDNIVLGQKKHLVSLLNTY